jgi:hypothetical protein
MKPRYSVFALARNAMRLYPRLCPNYLVTTRALELEPADRDYYVARELAQMVPLWGQVTYESLRARNAWMVEFQPNAVVEQCARRERAPGVFALGARTARTIS